MKILNYFFCKKSSILIFLGLIFILFVYGCGSQQETYHVSGQIIDQEGKGVEGVTIKFCGGHGTAKTDEEGKWTKTDLHGVVTVTPVLEEYISTPPFQIVYNEQENIDFTNYKTYPNDEQIELRDQPVAFEDGLIIDPGKQFEEENDKKVYCVVKKHEPEEYNLDPFLETRRLNEITLEDLLGNEVKPEETIRIKFTVPPEMETDKVHLVYWNDEEQIEIKETKEVAKNTLMAEVQQFSYFALTEEVDAVLKKPTDWTVPEHTGFVRVEGQAIPIHVPSLENSSNANFNDPDWNQVYQKELEGVDKDWWRLASFEPGAGDGAEALILGLVEALDQVAHKLQTRLTIQENSKGDKRAIVEIGQPQGEYPIYEKAGQNWVIGNEFDPYASFSHQIVRYYVETYEIPREWWQRFVLNLYIDPRHGEPPYYHGYLSVDEKGNLQMTPILYPETNLALKSITGGDWEIPVLSHGKLSDQYGGAIRETVSNTFSFHKDLESTSLTIQVDGEGSVYPPQGTHYFEPGEKVNIEAIPAEDWEFKEWIGDVQDPEKPQTIVVMDSDRTIQAVFKEEKEAEFPRYSNDYFGLIDGGSLLFKGKEGYNDNYSEFETKWSYSFVETKNGIDIFEHKQQDQGGNSSTSINYFTRNGQKYYNFSNYEEIFKGDLFNKEAGFFMVEKPVSKGDKGFQLELDGPLAKAKKIEEINTPAGSFNAWRFSKTYEDKNQDFTEFNFWFIPFIGLGRMEVFFSNGDYFIVELVDFNF